MPTERAYLDAAAVVDARPGGDAVHDVSTVEGGASELASPHAADAAHVAPRVQIIHSAEDRPTFVVMPTTAVRPARLVVMIHGACTGPSYVCGAWASAASEVGLLVCPTGNATCGPEGTGPPTWEGPFSGIDSDVELALAAARRKVSVPTTREDSVLVGYSRGGYAAVTIAKRHPGRWPRLIVNEADVDVSATMLRKAGVRSVAFVAGELGTQIAGERRTVDALVADGYPARLWEMPKVGHPYSPNIDQIMREALAFVLQSDTSTPAPTP
jgi:pimeloyl-ACP methyl ester carboxylesterase